MKTWITCNAVNLGAASLLLAGCGGSQPIMVASGAVPQTSALAAHADHGGSWMLPEARSEDLLYASRYSAGVSVYSYASGRKVGQLNGMVNIRGLCSDADGNVYVTSEPGAVYEYAHGGSNPINTFTDPGSAYGCAVDPRTGDLAVTNYSNQGSEYGNVAVFQNGSETPTTYSLKNIAEFLFCTYDGRGNLYASGISDRLGHGVFQLPYGGHALRALKLSQSLAPDSIQWAGDRLTIATPTSKKSGIASIYPVKISGDTGKVEAPVLLQNAFKGGGFGQYWIQSGMITGPARILRNGALRFWKYPQGGSPGKSIRSSSKSLFTGVTVSVAPVH